MATYVILSKIAPMAFNDPKEFKDIAAKVADRIKTECPGVAWKHSYATLGRFDVVDKENSCQAALDFFHKEGENHFSDKNIDFRYKKQ